MMEGVDHHNTTIDGLRFHYVTAGPTSGVPVVLLHGFPDFWFGWRHQIPALADAGFRVIVPDQRGYNLTDRPKSTRKYDLDRLAQDIVDLMAHEGHDAFHVVGHDWGGGIAWRIAVQHVERVRSLAVLNCPHPSDLAKAIRTDRVQRRMSWYMFVFQLPWLPELAMRRNQFDLLATAVWGHAPDALSDDDKARYREAWSRPGVARAMLNWYRAAARRKPAPWRTREVNVRTLQLFGVDDKYLDVRFAEKSQERCASGRLERLPATHWVQHDQHDAVNTALISWLDE